MRARARANESSACLGAGRSTTSHNDPRIVTVTATNLTIDAIRLMREKNVTALPVVKADRLVGIVSEHDFLPILARLLRERDEAGA